MQLVFMKIMCRALILLPALLFIKYIQEQMKRVNKTVSQTLTIHYRRVANMYNRHIIDFRL